MNALNRAIPDINFRDESPHPESSLEWWYIHGWLRGEEYPERAFMFSFFRHKLLGDQDAYSFLLALQGKSPGIHHTRSWVTRSLIDQIRSRSNFIFSLNLDKNVLEAFLEEFAVSATPREITALDEDPEINAPLLSIRWQDVQLNQTREGFALSCLDPEDSTTLRLELKPARKPAELKDEFSFGSSLHQMNYICYPGMLVSGTSGNFPVAGEGWLDHQWGRHEWFYQHGEEKRTLGWDFFAFCLGETANFSLLIHRDTVSGRICGQKIVKQDQDGTIESTSRFSAEPTRFWDSPSSAINHPVVWEFRVPEWEMKFTFSPAYDNQEIAVLGLQRRIWQGSGFIEGLWKNQPFQTRARAELQGYGFIHDPQVFLQRMADKIDRHIAKFLPESLGEEKLRDFLGNPTWEYSPLPHHAMLTVPVWDLLSRQGKRWRPIFALLLLDALGTPPQPYESLVAILGELPHTGSLIIDDIQDSSPIRRGEASIHDLYGQDVAISAANTLYFLCSHPLFGHPELDRDQQLDIHEVVNKFFTRAHFGQAQDLYWSKNLSRANLDYWLQDSMEEKLLQMYELKTSSPLQALALSACIINRAEREVRNASEDYARALGVAFQIIDDINNFSYSPRWRKLPGEDIAAGKVTFVILKALESLGNQEQDRLKLILTSPELRRLPEYQVEASSLIKASDGFSASREFAGKLIEKEWKKLSTHLEPSHSKILLRGFNKKLIYDDLEDEENGERATRSLEK